MEKTSAAESEAVLKLRSMIPPVPYDKPAKRIHFDSEAWWKKYEKIGRQIPDDIGTTQSEQRSQV